MRTIVPNVRTLVLSCTFLLSSFFSFSQSLSFNDKVEAGFGIGPMFFLGDLGGNSGKGGLFVKDINLPLTKLAKGITLNIYPQEWLGIRLAVNQGMLEGADSVIHAKGGDEMLRKDRNLSFRTNMLEAYGALEFYPTIPFEKYDGLQGKFRPYGVIGFGMFHFNPQGQYEAPDGSKKWVDLQPLRLEGQGMSEYPDRPFYKLTQQEFLLGAGFKYYLTETLYVGLEFLHRKTFTDYIDDVSTTYIDANLFDKYLPVEQAEVARQMYDKSATNLMRVGTGGERGNPGNKDAFFSTIIKFGWRLSNLPTPRQLLCPHI
jgi:hypothetical protein